MVENSALFPGQGAQSVGMLSPLLKDFPSVSETVEEASDVLGYDMAHLLAEGPAERLNQTVYTQPAMLTAGIACYRLWLQQGGRAASWLAGHSLGEYSALVAAKVLSFGDALRLVRHRGTLMQQAVANGVGGMLAVLGLSDNEVESLCKDSQAEGEVLAAANYNAPQQVVVAGHKRALQRLLENLPAVGGKGRWLAVSIPSHCQLLYPAALELRAYLAQLSLSCPDGKIVHNVDAQHYDAAQDLRWALVEQLYRPVRWQDVMRSLCSETPARLLLEFGPGGILRGLARRIDKRYTVFSVYDAASLERALEQQQEKNR